MGIEKEKNMNVDINVKSLIRDIKGHVKLIIVDMMTQKVTIKEYENLFTTVGKNSLFQRLAGDSSKGLITYGAVGTGLSTPSITDIKLNNEVFRKSISTLLVNNTLLIARLFLSTSEGNYYLKEFGLFGDNATGSTDSGTLFDRCIVEHNKVSSETVTIEVILEFV